MFKRDRAHLDDGKSHKNAWSKALSWHDSDDIKHKNVRTQTG